AEGVAGGANSPRVYFRKNAGSYFSTQCTGSSPAYACSIDSALMGGVSAGDAIDYFVIAQDTAGHVVSNPRAGLVAASVTSVSAAPSPVPGYHIVAPIPATLDVGGAQAVNLLTNPGGLFERINKG